MHKTLKYTLFSVLFTLTFLLGIDYFLGFFLEDAEVLINFKVADIARKGLSTPNLSDVNFLFYNLVVELQKKISCINIYAAYKLFIDAFIIIVLFASFFSAKNRQRAFFFVFVSLFFLVDAFAFIQTNKLVGLVLIVSSLFLYRNFHKQSSKVVFYLGLLIGIGIRVDLAVIFMAFIAFFAILYLEKPLRKHLIIGLFLSVFGLALFIQKANSNVDNLKDFHLYERAIQDREDFILNDRVFDPNLSAFETKLVAKAYFLLDEKMLDPINYQNLVKHEGLIDYTFNNPAFVSIYFSKLHDLFYEIFNRYLVVFVVCLFSIACLAFFSLNSSIAFVRFILLLIAYLAIPLLINVVALLDLSFIFAYMLFPFFILLELIVSRKLLKPKVLKLIFVSFIFLTSLNLVFFVLPLRLEKKAEEAAKRLVLASFKTDLEKGLTPVLAYMEYDMFMSSNIRYSYDSLDLVFLDAGAYNYIPYFVESYKNFYGLDYTSFVSRLEVVVEKNSYLYGKESTLVFMHNYLDKVYNIQLDYQVLEAYNNNFCKYRISLH